VALGDLPQADIGMADTVVVPPARAMQVNHEMRKRLDVLDRAMTDTVRDASCAA
jgi:hypothetical protein